MGRSFVIPVIAFVWENFGPMHVDRCEAVAAQFAGEADVIGIELFSSSSVYDWNPESGSSFKKVTLFDGGDWTTVGPIALAARILRIARTHRVTDIFYCNYNVTGILLAAIGSRLTGCRVNAMGCSKFDDYPRRLSREWLKTLYLKPYQGAVASGVRSRDYLRLLGIPPARIVPEYNTLSINRIRRLSNTVPAPAGTPYRDRHFAIVARLVPHKNIAAAIDAFALYRSTATSPRKLSIYGSGPQEQALRDQVERLGLNDGVIFHGFLQTDAIAVALGEAVALILPSFEEQFGNVVIEAQAMSVPVILSGRCGAADKLVRSGLNGFVVEPDAPESIAYFMRQIGDDEALWSAMCRASAKRADDNDAPRFAEGVRALLPLSASDQARAASSNVASASPSDSPIRK